MSEENIIIETGRSIEKVVNGYYISITVSNSVLIYLSRIDVCRGVRVIIYISKDTARKLVEFIKGILVKKKHWVFTTVYAKKEGRFTVKDGLKWFEIFVDNNKAKLELVLVDITLGEYHFTVDIPLKVLYEIAELIEKVL